MGIGDVEWVGNRMKGVLRNGDIDRLGGCWGATGVRRMWVGDLACLAHQIYVSNCMAGHAGGYFAQSSMPKT